MELQEAIKIYDSICDQFDYTDREYVEPATKQHLSDEDLKNEERMLHMGPTEMFLKNLNDRHFWGAAL